jgi:diguanylate cyclase (GGDEF)-like protein
MPRQAEGPGDDAVRLSVAVAVSALWNRLPRAATAVLAVVLLVLGLTAAFGLARSNQASAAAAGKSELADLFQQAEVAVATQAFYTRQYRLEPSSAVKLRYTAASESATSILAEAGEAAGDARTRELSRSLRDDHQTYSEAAERLIAAVAVRDPNTSIIDSAEVAPAYFILQDRMDRAAADFRGEAEEGLAEVRRTQQEMLIGTSVMLPLAAGCLVLVWRRVRSYQVDLEAESVRSAHQATHDPLTGLPNRTLFAERLEGAIARCRRQGSVCAVLVVDLDRFKQVNDTLGHHAGDLLLTECARRMTMALRDGDVVARMGGDEFAVLLPRVSGPDDADMVARRLESLVGTPYQLSGSTAEIACSIGVAMLDGETDVDEVIREADTAMYCAKTDGGGVRFSSGGTVRDAIADRVAGRSQRRDGSIEDVLLEDLRRAIWTKPEQLQLHWQPIVDAHTGGVVSVEALARWEHPEHGTMSPDVFIPLAEAAGLVGAMTDHLLAAALSQAAALRDLGYPTPVSVNLSASTLGMRTHLQVLDALVASGVEPYLLRIEVTESELIRRPDDALEALTLLRESGIEISLDDFGTGHSSLARLATLPLDELKLDRSVVSAADTDFRQAAIVRAAAALGHELGLRVVAEGVEDEQTAHVVRRLGCDAIQGYLFGRPMPAQELVEWMDSNHARTVTPASLTA